MNHKIAGTTLQTVTVELSEGEIFYSESGGMSWMSANIKMETEGKGAGQMISRLFTGESLFVNKFTATSGTGIVAFSASLPGKIVPIQLGEGESLICQKQSYLCGESTVTTKIHFRPSLGRGLFGGEGFIMQELTGPGLAFLEIDGEAVEYQLEANQEFSVDNGYIAYYEPTITYDVKMNKGARNFLFGGEGLFMASIKGPGKVVLQTMPAAKLAAKLIPYISTKQ